jgi:ferredoxin
MDLCKNISKAGNLAIPMLDLCQTASKALNVRGTPPAGTPMQRGMIGLLPFAFIPDCRSNRFAAVAAGLGVLGYNGTVLTEKYGPRQRFICVLTDLELEENAILDYDPGCAQCKKCLNACPTMAMSSDSTTEFSVGDAKFAIPALDQSRCDWAMRFGLSGKAGMEHLGSSTDIAPPEKMTMSGIAEAFEERDQLQDHFASVLEPCMKVCPAPFSGK